MTRGNRGQGQRPHATPLDQAVLTDQGFMAAQLSELLEATKDFDQGSVKGVLYQKPENGQGSYKWISEVFPPWNLSAIFTDLKDRFGGGEFELRVYADGRIRKNVVFSIAREREKPAPAPGAAAFGGADLMAIILNQQAEARRDQMNMMAMMQKSTTDMMAAVLPALAGRSGGGSAADTIALVTALQANRPDGASMKDMVETLVALKGLTDTGGGGSASGDGGGLDLAEILSDGGRLVGPAVKALADLVQQRRDAGAPGGHSASGAPAQSAGGQLALGAPGAPASRYRVLDLVRTDVLYFFGRGFDPEKAADLVYDVIEANIEAGAISEGDVNEVAAAFALSPTGLADLAAEGVDLTSNPQWAGEFFQQLAAIHSDATSNLGGEPGRAANTDDHGEASQAREA